MRPAGHSQPKRKKRSVLKKIVIITSAAAVTMLCGVGVASAHEAGDDNGNTNCTSDDNTHQSNKGHQFVGGNLSAQDIQGNVPIFGAQAQRPSGICPSIGNNNHL
jgi:hypothetical protein